MKRNLLLLSLSLFSFNTIIHNKTPETKTTIDGPKKTTIKITKKVKKPWTFIVYIAGDNDLDYFAGKNIKEMAKVGSSKNINIIAQVDRQGYYSNTKRLYIEKHKAVQVDKDSPSSQHKLDFGSAFTLIDCFEWAVRDYPADHYALILWNHGSGILDNVGRGASDASELFNFNPETNMLEINRNIGYLDYIQQKNKRGICFGDTYGTYLTNQKLEYGLKQIQLNILNNKKIDIIGFDACLMGMIEVGNLIRPYTDYMIASQEIELGAGWPYNKVLEPFASKSLTPKEFGDHIVNVYSDHYKSITYDYTLSSVNLNNLYFVEKSLHKTCHLLVQALEHQRNNTVAELIKTSRSQYLCTCYSEPSYIDLHHFLTNIMNSIDKVVLPIEKKCLINKIKESIKETIKRIDLSVEKNLCGRNLAKSKGISIYFPTRFIDQSYTITPFAKHHAWSDLLEMLN